MPRRRPGQIRAGAPGRPLPTPMSRRLVRRRWSGEFRRATGNHTEVPPSDVPPLAVDDRGNTLISFAPGADGAPPRDAPGPAALVAVWRADSVLMVFGRWRQGWE